MIMVFKVERVRDRQRVREPAWNLPLRVVFEDSPFTA